MHELTTAKFPVVDVHNHLGGKQTLTADASPFANECGGVRPSSISMAAGSRFKTLLLDELIPDVPDIRLVDFRGIDEEGWSQAKRSLEAFRSVPKV
jgi:hypothetical protein